MKLHFNKKYWSKLLLISILLPLLFASGDIKAAYTTSSFVASLNLDENSGTIAYDSSGNNNHGTVLGTPTWSAGDMVLDGVDDRISITDSNTLDGPSYTYEIWFTMPNSTKWATLPNESARLIDKIPYPATNSGSNIVIAKSTRLIRMNMPGSTWSNVAPGSTTSSVLVGSTALDYSGKYHIVYSYDNTTRLGQTYMNNVLVSSGTSSGHYIPNTTTLTVGGMETDNTRNIAGTVHRLTVYNAALTADQVAANYAEGSEYNYLSLTASPTLSTVSASKSSIVGDNSDSSTITVDVKNISNSPLANKTVVLTSNREGRDIVSPASATTNELGQAAFTIKSNTAGSSEFTAVADGMIIAQKATISVSEDVNTASASQSTVLSSLPEIKSDGISVGTLTITAKNSSDQALAGKTITVSSNRGGLDTISPASAVSDENGQAIFSVKSHTVGFSEFTAVISSIPIMNKATTEFISGIVLEKNVNHVSTLDSLNLKMDVGYDGTKSNLPVILVMHGHTAVLANSDSILNRLAAKGLFVIVTYKRSYGGSEGTSDDGGREIYDFYDAVEYVKQNYSQYIDPSNINVVGYSGGGGNAYGLSAKFPDYFRSINMFFGMSDYGHDNTYGWYNNGASESQQTVMQSRIGGTPESVPDNYYARAHYLAAKNNPYSQLQFFYDTQETNVPVTHASQYTAQMDLYGLTNYALHESDTSTHITEYSKDFSSNPLSSWILENQGNSGIVFNLVGQNLAWNFTSDTSLNRNLGYQKFGSFRNYAKTDHVYADFDFKVTSMDAGNNASALFGFHDSDSSSFKNSALVMLKSIDATTYNANLRIDYNGTEYDAANTEILPFSTVLNRGTSYKFRLEIVAGNLVGVLKNDSGTTLETQTLTFNGANQFQEIDDFIMQNLSGNAETQGNMTGNIDSLNIEGYARFIHGAPTEDGTKEGNIVGENYFIPSIIAGDYAQPSLSTSGSMFVPGYVKTSKFKVFLGNGSDEAANLTYNVAGAGTSLTSAKRLTLEGLTGTADAALTLYGLTASTDYIVKDSDLTHNNVSSTVVTTDSDGILNYNGVLGSTHQFDIYINSSAIIDAIIDAISNNIAYTSQPNTNDSTTEAAIANNTVDTSPSETTSSKQSELNTANDPVVTDTETEKNEIAQGDEKSTTDIERNKTTEGEKKSTNWVLIISGLLSVVIVSLLLLKRRFTAKT